MQFVINGVTYEAASLERVTGATALDLTRKEPNGPGIGVKSLALRLEEMSRLGYDADGDPVVLPEGAAGVDASAVLDSGPHLRALLAFVWVSRRLDGDPGLKWADAIDFPITSLEIVADDDEAEDETPDPQSPSLASPLDPPAASDGSDDPASAA